MAQPQLYIIHGYGGAPDRHWFPWLQDQIGDRAETHIPQLPDPDQPEPQAWQDALDAAIERLDAHTYLVAHSLGCVSLLRFLQGKPEARVGGVVLVSGFTREIERYPNLAAFLEAPLDFAQLRRQSPHYTLLTSDNDTHVPPDLTRRLATDLGGHLIQIPGAGHFIDEDGVQELPEVRDALLQMMSADA
ncbi:MAG: hypothetical protein E1N59_2532 [Puniceicoccaceae bacterium 5H]|nr:MAG: hypothetical protein E1N59_2532 [Puniceicoccaceae bacterium 5H]